MTQQQRGYGSLRNSFDWRAMVAGLIIIALLIAVGPLTLFLSWPIQVWCNRSIFDARDRWNSERAFAWVANGLLALLILAFLVAPSPMLHLWMSSPLRFLGRPLDLVEDIWLRWLVSLPISLILALIVEWPGPRPPVHFTRIATEAEKTRAAAKHQREQEQTRRSAQPPAAQVRAAIITASRQPPKKVVRSPGAKQSRPAQNPPRVIPPPSPPKKPDLGDGSMDALL